MNLSATFLSVSINAFKNHQTPFLDFQQKDFSETKEMNSDKLGIFNNS